ncbi:hypothetical protein CDL15_Pgr011722 [Punica granatum]|uniref:Uncharacterized protein n=1 Tax=Punica granatum TaxID=22663 RepID=A0A218XFI8_PUNGR|nr:hypothetical protein CDL15_Pgr011722 [Punica granatum]
MHIRVCTDVGGAGRHAGACAGARGAQLAGARACAGRAAGRCAGARERAATGDCSHESTIFTRNEEINLK